MSGDIKVVELAVFMVIFVFVSVLGFVASRWRRPDDLESLDEWGLGGRNFGTWITWFLIGGDLYTAYTFVAVPALVFGAGAAGFFAVPYTVVIYPMVFLILARMWSVSAVHGFVTPADFVRARHGSSTLALLVAITGIIATMPYIALQLVGIEAILLTMGVEGEIPLIVAFLILAAYTYNSGLRAPALIAFVKDTLIYIVVIACVIVIPIQLGGWGVIFDDAEAKFSASEKLTDGLSLGGSAQLNYATLALGSAMALFLYPHSLTGVLAASSRNVIKRNMAALPAYTLLLGMLAMLGYMAIAAGITPIGDNTNTIVPNLLDRQFPSWFTGIAFAAIGIGALVPAAIMSIAAANLWTRNIYKEYINPAATPKQEAKSSKLASLFVKFGALGAILMLDPQFSIDLQLIGGVIILQTLPAVAISLYTRWFHRWALIAGWAAGMLTGLILVYNIENPAKGKKHFGGSAFELSKLGFDTDWTIYAGVLALAVNLVVCVVATRMLRAYGAPEGVDLTKPEDYQVAEVEHGGGEIHTAAAPAKPEVLTPTPG